jgi:hypothetical protein
MASTKAGSASFAPLATKPVRRFPGHHQGLSDRLIVETGSGRDRELKAPGAGSAALEHPQGVLAVKAGHLDQFIQDLVLFGPGAGMIPSGHRFNEFASGRHRELLGHVVAHPV